MKYRHPSWHLYYQSKYTSFKRICFPPVLKYIFFMNVEKQAVTQILCYDSSRTKTINILSFVSHMVPIASIQVWLYRRNAAIENMEMNEWGHELIYVTYKNRQRLELGLCGTVLPAMLQNIFCYPIPFHKASTLTFTSFWSALFPLFFPDSPPVVSPQWNCHGFGKTLLDSLHLLTNLFLFL